MAVEFEIGNLHAVAWFALVEVVDDFRAFVEPDEVDAVFVAHGDDVGYEIDFILSLGAAVVAGAMDEPGDGGTWVLLLDFLNADAGGADEISPPAVVRIGFVFFPFLEGGAATEENVFPFDLGEGCGDTEQ